MGLSVFMQSFKFIATLMMMRDILPHLSSLSKAMQARDAVFTVVQPLVNGTISLLKTLQTSPGENYNSVQGLLKRLHDEGFNIRMPTETQLDDFKSTVYVPFLQNLIDNLDARFPDLPTIMHFSAFDATCFPEESMGHGNTEIKALAEHLKLPVDQAIEQWMLVKATVKERKDLQEAKAEKVMHYLAGLQESHPVLHKIACVGLLLPTSTDDCERGFSAMKRIKTEHRNSLSNKILNSLLAISIHGQEVESFPFSKCVEEWYELLFV